jgi:LuxR family maltose regulon positive regulatory protein
LIDCLKEGMACKLVLVSAPAGFGKTTLISVWARQDDMPVAWLSIDSSDNNPLLFVSYLIAALQTVDKSIGTAALSMLQSPQPPPLESTLITLINSIAPKACDFALVLDDFHLVDNAEIHDLLAFLIAHQPPQMHIILATRADPLLPLGKLRARNQLIEIRAADLCFSTPEIDELFNEKLKLGLSSNDIELLGSRTEGWVSGLQLAAHSLQKRRDRAAFIEEFKGDNRHIIDYLGEEVLNHQPEPIQNFLIQTSILNRLSASLCEAITEQSNCQKMLDDLDRADLFVFPLDSERNWFRYHQLFADLLKQRLCTFPEDDVKKLHHRAYEWYFQNGFREEAMEHALAAEDFGHVANLLEELSESVWDRGHQVGMLKWFAALPEEILMSRLNLLIYYARSLNMAGQQEEAESKLQKAEQILESLSTESVDVPRANSEYPEKLTKDELLGRMATIRAFMAAYKGDMPGIINHSRRAIVSLNERDLMWRSVAATTLGFAHGWSGDGDMMSARFAFSEAIAISELGGNTFFNLFARSCLAHIDAHQGRLKQAQDSYHQLLKHAEDSDLCYTGLAASIKSSLGLILCEKNELGLGTGLVQEGLDQIQQGYDIVTLSACKLNMARALFYRGDMIQVLSQIEDIEKTAFESSIPPWVIHASSALKATVWLRCGQQNDIKRWIAERELGYGTKLSYRREAEHVVLARFFLSQGQYGEAETLLDRLLEEAETGMRIWSSILMRLLKAQIERVQDKQSSALDELGMALYLGEPGKFVRTFVMEGEPIAELLERILDREDGIPDDDSRGFSRSYVKKLLSAFKAEIKPKSAVGLDEALSEREYEVLRLIAAGLSNKEIAEKLFVSLNTIRTHTKNINAKLDVHSRTQAVARAKELNLL